MATYEELYALQNNDKLIDQVAMALIVAAHNTLADAPSDAQAAWAADTIKYPTRDSARTILLLILAANRSSDAGVITNATDAQVQINIDEIVPGLIQGAAILRN